MSLYLKKEIDNMLSFDDKQAIGMCSSFADELGINIYLIGGIVRDFIMKNEVKDIDITVEGDAIEFAKILISKTDCEIVQVQENLRTAKVVFESGVQIDFASTREETYSKSGFLPVAHNFGCSLEDDVKRRDFTINTLAIKLTQTNKYSLVDFYGGYKDILDKKIKILHEKSFIDDPSRIIRALKFKERFDFELDKKTKVLMMQYLQNVDKNIPLERIKSELKQYLSIAKDDIYKKFIESEAYKLISDDPILSFDISKLDEIAEFQIFHKSEIWLIYFLCLILNSDFPIQKLNLTSQENKILMQTKDLLSCDFQEESDEKIHKHYKDKENLSLVLYYVLSGKRSVIKFLAQLKDIAVLTTGKDLINLGFSPSKYFSEIFDKVLKEKISGRIKTKEEEIKFIENKIRNKMDFNKQKP